MKIGRKIGLVCLLSYLALAAGSKQNLNASSPRDIQASILIVDSKEAIARWVMDPKEGDSGRLRSVAVGQKIFVPVVITGLETMDYDRPGIVADMQLISPDGKVMFDGQKCCGANRGDPRMPGLVVLNPVLDLTAEAGDPLGTYEIRATVTYGGLTARTSEKFVLTASGGSQ